VPFPVAALRMLSARLRDAADRNPGGVGTMIDGDIG
jgi:hypothetical protein